jgi:hypothetical protein
MADRKKLRKKLFDIYSKNLEWAKEDPSMLRFEPDFENGYVCPICFDIFFEKDLESTSPNPLTIEDVPPVSLGGKPKILTCKKCNSEAGYKLDSHLLTRLLEIDFHSLLPNSKAKSTFELNGSKVNGTVEVDKDGKLVINFDSERSNPEHSKKFLQDLLPPQTFSGSLLGLNRLFDNSQHTTDPFTMSKPNQSDTRKAELALLRIAYLWALSFFGNGFYYSHSIHKVRYQLHNPEEEFLPRVFWFNYEYPEDMLGMNIVKSPVELRCFLVIFNLTTKSAKRQYAIALPGPTSPGIKIYDNIERILCNGSGEKINIEIEHLGEEDYLLQKDLTFASTGYWKGAIKKKIL